MTTRADLLALADRVEREEPGEELRLRIGLAIFDYNVMVKDDASKFPTDSVIVKARSIWNDQWPYWDQPSQVKAAVMHLGLPDWLHSLDAAASLVPDGWEVADLYQFRRAYEDTLRWKCGLYRDLETEVTGAADTEPRARTAAALRARAQEMKDE